MDPDDRTQFLEQLPAFRRNELLKSLNPKEQEIARTLLNYPEQSIGRLMTTDFVAVKPHYTVQQALAHIRKYGQDSETLNIIYVVDASWRLIDDLRIRSLLLADASQLIADLLDNRFVSLKAYDDQETAIQIFREQDRVALPVVDDESKLLGIVTVDDIMDVAEEETTEDFHKFGSFQKSIISPLKARVLELYKSRIVWLTILVFMNVFSGAALASFEGVIESMVSLVFFLPLLIDSGGNAGAQSATLMIRALAIGDVQMKDWLKLLSKELFVSLLLGLTMAVGVSLIASFRAPEIIFIVALTMIFTVMVGSMIGLMLPFLFTRFNVDPATASAPLITSLADILGVLIYFTIASKFLQLT